MLFSCKISNTILTYLERKSGDLSPLLEAAPLPEEFLRDTSYWLKAADMERFLEMALSSPVAREEENFLQKVGHSTPELRSWGVLDSVLRMMPRPQEILAQAERFFSYFISPQPPVANIVRADSSIELDLPVLSDQYPLTTAYLRAGLESLPVFVGKGLAQCQWQGTHIKIEWETAQNSIFQELDPGHQLSPELLRSIVSSLEKHQRELQGKNAELQQRHDQLVKAHRELESEIQKKMSLEKVTVNQQRQTEVMDATSADILRNQIARLGDYMVRAQQLITLLIGQDRMSPAVKEAMRRVDWDLVKTQFPQAMEACHLVLNQQRKEEKSHV